MTTDIRSFRLTVKPRGALFFGGYSAAQSASGGDTAHDSAGILIPASSLKGALRESAHRLVRAANHGEQPLLSLFGDEAAESEGKLRFGPLRPSEDHANPYGVRHHVSLVRETRSASHGHLFEQKVVAAGLELGLTGTLEVVAPLTEIEIDLLKAAAQTTDQLGAGRGRGLGHVEIHLEPCSQPASLETKIDLPAALTQEKSLAAEATSSPDPPVWEVVLELEVVEPLKLGKVKDRSNVESTQEVIAGSMFRGAVAAAVYRLPDLDKDEQESMLQSLMGEPRPVIFGDGHPVPSGAADHGVMDVVYAPGTLKVSKAREGTPRDSALDICLMAVGGESSASRPRGVAAATGSWALTSPKSKGPWERVSVPRRLITRLARDSISGRAAEGKLYSLDVVDPGAATHRGPLLYQLPIQGTADPLHGVIRAVQAGVRVGGTRSRGFGAVKLRRVLQVERPSLTERHRRWTRALERRGLDKATATSTGVLLAQGPVALHQPRLEARFAELGLKLIGGSSNRRLMGGWNSRVNLPRTAQGCFLPGSVWIVRTLDSGSALPALEILEREGLGPGRADGWGRLVVCHPIHWHGSEPSLSEPSLSEPRSKS